MLDVGKLTDAEADILEHALSFLDNEGISPPCLSRSSPESINAWNTLNKALEAGIVAKGTVKPHTIITMEVFNDGSSILSVIHGDHAPETIATFRSDERVSVISNNQLWVTGVVKSTIIKLVNLLGSL